MKELAQNHSLILMEGAVIERLRRSNKITLHDTLVHAPFIYDPQAGDLLKAVYQSYIDVAQAAGLPLLLCSPTWRTNKERVEQSGINQTVNFDAVHFMRELAGDNRAIKIGGTVGCKNDCYRPEEGLSTQEARTFHRWQVEQLVAGGPDFLMTQTLPNIHEALGIAQAMQDTGIPYIISLVISRNGQVLDGHTLKDAIEFIDLNTENPPLGYMINCAHPSFLCPETQPPEVFERLIGYQANASSLDHCDLDKARELKQDDRIEWGDLMLELNRKYGINILGGCCGTGVEHMRYLTEH